MSKVHYAASGAFLNTCNSVMPMSRRRMYRAYVKPFIILCQRIFFGAPLQSCTPQNDVLASTLCTLFKPHFVPETLRFAVRWHLLDTSTANASLYDWVEDLHHRISTYLPSWSGYLTNMPNTRRSNIACHTQHPSMMPKQQASFLSNIWSPADEVHTPRRMEISHVHTNEAVYHFLW